MKRLLLAALALLLGCTPAYASTIGGGSMSGGSIADQAAPTVEQLMVLDLSPIFGPGGSVFDLTDRVAPPEYIDPPEPADFANSNTSMLNDVCSTDSSTQNKLIALIDGNGAGDVADDTVIWLPQDCRIKWFLKGKGNSAQASIGAINDRIMLHCENPLTCGIDAVYGEASHSNADFANLDNITEEMADGVAPYVYGGETRRWIFGVGSGRRAIADGATDCNWLPSYVNSFEFRSKVVLIDPVDCLVSHSGAAAIGPGDIMRVKTARITGYGQFVPGWLSRVTCVSDEDGDLDPATDPTGTLCNELVGLENGVQLKDMLPMDYQPNAYYWGNEGLGDGFTKYPGGPPSGVADPTGPTVYAPTSGHTITQVERVGSLRCETIGGEEVCGNGTATEHYPEDIWFSGLGWSVYPQYIGATVLRWPGAYGGGVFGGRLESSFGGPTVFTFGGDSVSGGNVRESGGISLHSIDWFGTGHNAKCYMEIIGINGSGSQVVITTHMHSTTRCGPASESAGSITFGEPVAGISGAADPDLNNALFLVSRSISDSGIPNPVADWEPFVSGAPAFDGTANDENYGLVTITLTGVDGRCPGDPGYVGGTSLCVDETPGGMIVGIDRFAGATYYQNTFSSNIQIVDNTFRNTRQHGIDQGCSGCVYAYNYVRADPANDVRGRGPFNHGTGGSCGNLYEGNRQDHPFFFMDSSNGESNRHPEGCNRVYYKNSMFDSGTLTWPIGSATPGGNGDYVSSAGTNESGDFIAASDTNQNGGANDKWGMILNVGLDMSNGVIDSCDNYDGDVAGGCLNDPGQLWGLAAYMNRTTTSGNNIDADFSSLTDAPNTHTDIYSPNEVGEGSPTVPAEFAATQGQEPASLWLKRVPPFWCANAVPFLEMGASYDNYSGVVAPIPAELRYFEIACEPIDCGEVDCDATQ